MDTAAKLEQDGLNLAEIDGVQVVWIDHPGDTSAVLSFRVGQADESLPSRGFSHLAEHSALSPFADATFDLNGTTGPTITRFMASARPETLATFITGVTEHLGRLAAVGLSEDDAARVRHDAKILQAEGETHGPSIVGAVLSDLYGSTGHGVVDWAELGLIDLDLDRFQAWVRTYFTRANAVLTLSCPPPQGLSLAALPDGDWMAPPSVESPFDDLPVHRRRPGPFALVAPVSRGMSSAAFTTIYERAIQSRLRHEGGMSYAPGATYAPVSAEHAFVYVTADSPDRHGTEITNGALGELDRLATAGPSLDEMHIHRTRALQALDSEFAQRQQLAYAGDELLYQRATPFTMDEKREQLAALTPTMIAEAAEEVRRSMVVSIPLDAEITNDRVPARPEWPTTEPVNGTTHISVPPPGAVGTNSMVLGKGVSLLTADGRQVTIRDDEAVALLRWDDGVDQLVGRDSMSIRLIPSRWPDAERIRSAFESLVPGDAVIRMGFRGVPPDTGPVPERPRYGLIAAAGFGVMALASLFWLVQERDIALLATFVLSVGAVGVFHWAWYQNLTTPQVYDDIDWHLSHESWRPELPISQAHLVGAIKLAWLTDRNLLAPWVERSAHQHLASYRSGQSSAIDLYRELGGMLTTDLLDQRAAVFFTWLDAPRRNQKRPADRWWKEMGFAAADANPYATVLDDALLARSHAWFDSEARRFRLMSFRPFPQDQA